jgi:SET domain-containing protein
MMLVPTYLDKSPIHGIGIFARDFIPRGTLVWEFTPDADQVFSAADLALLLPLQRETILFYGYIEPDREGVVLCCDNARHFNLLRGANCGSGDQSAHGYVSTLALRDIAAGEELTYPFEEDLDARRKLGEAEFLRQTGPGSGGEARSLFAAA